MMQQDQTRFGVTNLEYDMVTTLSNLLQGEEVLTRYAQDAEQAGDKQCAQLFRTIQENNRNAAMQMRSALARHLANAQMGMGQSDAAQQPMTQAQ
jgi:hypothetical protein